MCTRTHACTSKLHILPLWVRPFFIFVLFSFIFFGLFSVHSDVSFFHINNLSNARGLEVWHLCRHHWFVVFDVFVRVCMRLTITRRKRIGNMTSSSLPTLLGAVSTSRGWLMSSTLKCPRLSKPIRTALAVRWIDYYFFLIFIRFLLFFLICNFF